RARNVTGVQTCALPISGRLVRIFRSRECLIGLETGNAHPCDRGFCPACDHGVSLAPCDEFECFTDRVRACRTCRHCCAVRSFRTVLDGDLAACHIRDHHRHEERAHAPRPTLVEYFEAVFQRLDAADAGTDPDTDPLSVVIIYL